ncbi:hypothetical protein AB0I35_13040 [Nocardia sp. NPDC050378]|uniref:hypothetical protein n=1 Tax=Nocardia sp. NPDC050378 TaxID=3155400 RepID=UPI0033F56C30
MVTLTDIIDYDNGGLIYLLDRALDSQPRTISWDGERRLRPGVGALAISTGRDRSHGNLGRVSVGVGDGGFPPEPTGAEFIEEASYLTELGREYVGSSYYEECQGELAVGLTPPGPARVHVRLYEVAGPHESYSASAPGHETRSVPVDVHLLLHIWNEATA